MMAVALEAVLISEFDNDAGLVISCQAPRGAVDAATVGALSPLLVPAPELFGTVLSVDAFARVFLSVAACVDDKIYRRNRLIFNTCFVLSGYSQALSVHSNHLVAFQSAVRKMSFVLRKMEIECRFVSDTARKQQLQNLCTNVLSGIQADNMCIVRLDAANQLFLSIEGQRYGFQQPFLASFVQRGAENQSHTQNNVFEELAHQATATNIGQAPLSRTAPNRKARPRWQDVPRSAVPLPLRSLLDFVTPNVWHEPDLALSVILPLIDGIRHIERLAEVANVDVQIVQRAIHELCMLDGVVVLIDLFQYKNEYVPTEMLVRTLTDSDLRDRCFRFSTGTTPYLLSDPEISAAQAHSAEYANTDQLSLLLLYTLLENGKSVADLLSSPKVRDSLPTAFDPRRWIAFGITLKLIRRIHDYPLYVCPDGFDSYAKSIPHRKRNSSVESPYRLHISHSPNGARTAAATMTATPPATVMGVTDRDEGLRGLPFPGFNAVPQDMAGGPASSIGGYSTDASGDDKEVGRISTNSSSSALPLQGASIDTSLLTGRLHLDEISVLLGSAPSDVATYVADHPRCLLLKK
ncbi:Nitrogen permease regulator 2-like [Porphyridium purpureum]|uniref:Nitrogen permease regulator 2-like n=1 Tax=Porphyridium purpureum TaxID=35688 RepID=A0A5J4YUV3_PORPP|nr:Nitrogen permease regulator 2-like [Porphyridium purpureum]|eukprot:POR2842..scf227_4